MTNPIDYIYFKPDQVLTDDHLNETFSYLDQQNRWTRNKLIGTGIVCGLDILLNPGVIEVTRGCGVTSQGYLITLEDVLGKPTQYTYYMPFTPTDVPPDLPFTYPYGNLPFYKPFCKNKTIFLLLTDGQQSALDPAARSSANTISSATNSFLSDYEVVLFLEMKETDLKNCDMLDCNNKGDRMTFVVKPLLVPKKDLTSIKKQSDTSVQNGVTLPHQIEFQRYNVPYAELKSTDDVLNGFVKLVGDTILTQVANAFNYCYAQYGSILNITDNPFTGLLNSLKNYRDQVISKDPIFIEYFYDFIDDLIKAYYEFSVKASDLLSVCCPDENLFPLHLAIGSANKATSPFVKDGYRNYFNYSPLFSGLGSESAETLLLFNRMVIMVEQFNIQAAVQSQGLSNRQPITIKITPSQYEFPWLSERAIPYYYNVDVNGAELYKSWNYHKTSHGNAAYNLGYNAYRYNGNSAVTQPLLYDIEYYNFFRVEGHIGLDHETALSNIVRQRLHYNLPFDVVAVSADQLSSDAALPQCNIQDLETNYRLIVSDFACKVHNTFCALTKLKYPLEERTDTEFLKDMPPLNVLFEGQAAQGGLPDPPLIFGRSNYKKGSFINTYCKPVDGTVGFAYSNANFNNPVVLNDKSVISYWVFEFIDTVESLMFGFMTNSVSTLEVDSTSEFATTYQHYLYTLAAVITQMIAIVDHANANAAIGAALAAGFQIDEFMTDYYILLSICADDRLQTLKQEYLNRLQQYQMQFSFLNYFRKHPGLEHKAGVPKGGTLVLVYHTANRDIVFTNREFELLPANTLQEESVTRLPAYYDNSTIELIKSFVAGCNDNPAQQKQILQILSQQPVKKQKYEVEDGVVIADFYVPYLCCSDCPPVAYIIQQQQQPETATISIPTSLCSDVKPFAIALTPDNTGEVTSDDLAAAISKSGTWMFDPSKLFPDTSDKKAYINSGLVKTGSLLYTWNDTKTDPFPATIYRHPIADFKYEIETNEATLRLLLKAITETDVKTLKYSWIVSWTTSGQSPVTDSVSGIGRQVILTSDSIVSSKAREITITLSIDNQGCTAQAVFGPFDYRRMREGVFPDPDAKPGS